MFDKALADEGVTGPAADVARSIYQQESGSGRNTKTSNAGAVGGMQVIPATFNRMADQGWDINNPEHNARAGIRYIKTLNERAGGDPALTAAGYYGGEGAIDKARKGIAVSDPRNPNAPNTLQYGQQVADRLPKRNPLMQAANAVTSAIMPSANAAAISEVNPYDQFDMPSGKTAAPNPYDQFDPTAAAQTANPADGNSFLTNTALGLKKGFPTLALE
ncbi:lytic transglycosylase domain-containing protein [Herminiimonas sp. CN]|uniref:lytic transglycosylase domain-containing protein n=1 Tax=Herminiimonas sp. CN TaxID=1349818 RepID=UPI00138DD44B|nr:lytic transglycosylase domain-containing protein [Herminiimonas sp. CN]